jgi:hypothetical protein
VAVACSASVYPQIYALIIICPVYPTITLRCDLHCLLYLLTGKIPGKTVPHSLIHIPDIGFLDGFLCDVRLRPVGTIMV